MYTYLYLAEAITAVVAIAVGGIVFFKKRSRATWIYLILCVVAFLSIFAGTFSLEKPRMQVQETYTVEVNTDQRIEKPQTQYHFRDVTDRVEVNGDIDYGKVGEYPIEFSLKTTIGYYSKSATVFVRDTGAPQITLTGEETLTQSYKADYQEPGFQATDGCDGDLTAAVKVEKVEIDANSFRLLYTVEDSSGNKAEKSRTVTLVDDVKPVLTLNGSANMTVYLNEKYTEQGAKANDEKDGDLTTQITTEGTVDTAKEGNYTVTYRVKDRMGNEAVATRKVLVKRFLKAQDGTNGKKGTVYLTFDDGPSTAITPKVLDILKAKNVKATFFIINYDAAGEKIIQRAFAEGHTVAIHGYSHNYQAIYKSEEAYMENLTKLQAKIKASTGYTATVTRFPGGSSNMVSKFNPGIMTRLCTLVKEKGFTYFDWNVSSEDAAGAKTADAMYNNVVRGLKKNRQNVVLMHDFSSNAKIVEALPRIIDFGIENGYAFDRITETTPMVTHSPNN